MEDEDKEGPQIERGTVFPATVIQRDKQFPREACLGDVKVEKNIVTFNGEEDEDTLVEE